MATTSRSRLHLAIAAILALALATGACKKVDEGLPTMPVEKGELVAEQSFQGELVAKKSTPVTVPRAPRVDLLTVKTVLPDGAAVKKGDVIATFDTTEVEENLRSAKTDLAIAEAEKRKEEQALTTERIGLELEVKRRKMAVEEAKLKLVEGVNLISELERKKAQVQLDSAHVELKLAESALVTHAGKRATTLDVADVRVKTAADLVKENSTALEKLSVKAPADGVIYRPYVTMNYTRAKAEPGRVTRSNDKLLELPDLSTFDVVLQVRPRDAARMKVGDAAKVLITALGGKAIDGKISKKEDFATTRNERYGTKTPEGNLKEIAITIELAENPEGLRPGGTARVEIRSMLQKEAVMVPLAALSDERDGHAFVTLKGGERREIELGLANSTHGEVKKGLDGGEVLVLAPRVPNGRPAASK
jgi:HlyD family secretion protein